MLLHLCGGEFCPNSLRQIFKDEFDNTELVNRKSIIDGADADMLGIDGLFHNKVLLDENGEIIYVAGGDGGAAGKR